MFLNFYVFENPMKGALFFIILLALLIRGFNQLQDGKLVHTTCYLAAQEMKKSQRTKPADQPSVNKFSDQEHAVFMDVEEPEEDSHQEFARRCKLLTRVIPFHSDTFCLNSLYGCFPDRLPERGFLSCKYITQRALRI